MDGDPADPSGMLASVDLRSLTSVRTALADAGADTRTPGLRGQARLDVLVGRLKQIAAAAPRKSPPPRPAAATSLFDAGRESRSRERERGRPAEERGGSGAYSGYRGGGGGSGSAVAAAGNVDELELLSARSGDSRPGSSGGRPGSSGQRPPSSSSFRQGNGGRPGSSGGYGYGSYGGRGAGGGSSRSARDVSPGNDRGSGSSRTLPAAMGSAAIGASPSGRLYGTARLNAMSTPSAAALPSRNIPSRGTSRGGSRGTVFSREQRRATPSTAGESQRSVTTPSHPQGGDLQAAPAVKQQRAARYGASGTSYASAAGKGDAVGAVREPRATSPLVRELRHTSQRLGSAGSRPGSSGEASVESEGAPDSGTWGRSLGDAAEERGTGLRRMGSSDALKRAAGSMFATDGDRRGPAQRRDRYGDRSSGAAMPSGMPPKAQRGAKASSAAARADAIAEAKAAAAMARQASHGQDPVWATSQSLWAADDLDTAGRTSTPGGPPGASYNEELTPAERRALGILDVGESSSSEDEAAEVAPRPPSGGSRREAGLWGGGDQHMTASDSVAAARALRDQEREARAQEAEVRRQAEMRERYRQKKEQLEEEKREKQRKKAEERAAAERAIERAAAKTRAKERAAAERAAERAAQATARRRELGYEPASFGTIHEEPEKARRSSVVSWADGKDGSDDAEPARYDEDGVRIVSQAEAGVPPPPPRPNAKAKAKLSRVSSGGIASGGTSARRGFAGQGTRHAAESGLLSARSPHTGRGPPPGSSAVDDESDHMSSVSGFSDEASHFSSVSSPGRRHAGPRHSTRAGGGAPAHPGLARAGSGYSSGSFGGHGPGNVSARSSGMNTARTMPMTARSNVGDATPRATPRPPLVPPFTAIETPISTALAAQSVGGSVMDDGASTILTARSSVPPPPYTEREATTDPEKLVELAEYYFEDAHDVKAAERCFRKALVKDPKNPATLCAYAQLLRHAKRNVAAAKRTLETALGAHPTHLACLTEYADMMHHNNDAESAETMYRRGLDVDPHNSTLLLGYASLLRHSRGEADKAEVLVRKVLATEPHNGHAHAMLASLLQSGEAQGRSQGGETARETGHEEARAAYERAIEAQPHDGLLLGRFASFLKRKVGDIDLAEEMYRRATQLMPSHAGLVGDYANFVRKFRKDYPRADGLFKRALAAEPDHVNNLCNYAVLLKEMGRTDECGATYQRILTLAPNNANALGNYANYLKKFKRDYPGAKAMYLRALEVEPNHPMVARNYALLLRDVPELRSAPSTARSSRGRGPPPKKPPPPPGPPPDEKVKKPERHKSHARDLSLPWFGAKQRSYVPMPTVATTPRRKRMSLPASYSAGDLRRRGSGSSALFSGGSTPQSARTSASDYGAYARRSDGFRRGNADPVRSPAYASGGGKGAVRDWVMDAYSTQAYRPITEESLAAHDEYEGDFSGAAATEVQPPWSSGSRRGPPV